MGVCFLRLDLRDTRTELAESWVKFTKSFALGNWDEFYPFQIY